MRWLCKIGGGGLAYEMEFLQECVGNKFLWNQQLHPNTNIHLGL